MEDANGVTQERIPAGMFTRPSVVRAWAEQYGIHPSRSLGQNFLIDGNIRDIILDACAIRADDRFLEIGPGLGALTAGLLACGTQVVALEKDRRLLPPLQEHLGQRAGFQLVEGDALVHALPLIHTHNLDKVVSNLPYNPGSRILLDLVTAEQAPTRIVVTVQAEVAARVVARPRTTDFSLMSLWCQTFYATSLVKRVRPNCFWPRPRVQSAVLQLQRRTQSPLCRAGVPFFQAFSKRVFRYPRKQMGHIMALLGIDPGLTRGSAIDMLEPAWQHMRPADLSVDAWCVLSEQLRRKHVPAAMEQQQRKED